MPAFKSTAVTQPYRPEPLFLCRVSDTGHQHWRIGHQRAGIRNPAHHPTNAGALGEGRLWVGPCRSISVPRAAGIGARPPVLDAPA
jgi:hypothetical protein